MNDLHYRLGQEGFNEVFVDQMDPDVVAVTRHDPVTHQNVVLVAHTAFHQGVNLNRNKTGLVLKVEGQIVEVEIEACLEKTEEEELDFVKDSNVINGLTNFDVELKTHIDITDAKFAR